MLPPKILETVIRLEGFVMEEKMIQVTLVRSGNKRRESQRQTLQGLGLTKMHRMVRLKDTPAIRGMIRKVSHLVKIMEE